MIPIEVTGSRFPLGSSASSSGGGLKQRGALTAGELVRVAVDLGREADETQRLRHLLADLGPAGADHLQRIGDVVVDGAVGQQLEVLKDGADVAPQQRDLLVRQAADVASRDPHLALGRVELADQQLDQGRLAAARRTDQEDELAAPNRQRDSFQGKVATRIDLGDVVELDDRRRSAPDRDLLVVPSPIPTQSRHARPNRLGRDELR